MNFTANKLFSLTLYMYIEKEEEEEEEEEEEVVVEEWNKNSEERDRKKKEEIDLLLEQWLVPSLTLMQLNMEMTTC